jgi:hypothetical protein
MSLGARTFFWFSLMVLSTSWESANCAATQELLRTLWNLEVHYCVHKSPPLVPILSHIYPIHTTPSYHSKTHFNMVHTPMFWSSQWSLSFWLSHQYSICIPLIPIRATCPAHFILLYLIIPIILGEQYKSWNSSLCSFLHQPTSWSSQWHLSFWISHQYPICIPILPQSCYMPCPSHPPCMRSLSVVTAKDSLKCS